MLAGLLDLLVACVLVLLLAIAWMVGGHLAERMSVAKQLATLAPSFDGFITVDFAVQGYDDSTPYATVQARLVTLALNVVALGFGD